MSGYDSDDDDGDGDSEEDAAYAAAVAASGANGPPAKKAKKQTQITKLTHGAVGFRYLAVSPDGKRLLSSSYSDEVCVWDLTTNTLQRTVETNCLEMKIAFIQNNKPRVMYTVTSQAANADPDWDDLREIDIDTGNNTLIVPEGRAFYFFSPSSKFVVMETENALVVVYNRETKVQRAIPEIEIYGAAISNSNTLLVALEHFADRLLLVDLTANQAATTHIDLPHQTDLFEMPIFSPDDKLIAISTQNKIHLCDPVTRQVIRTLMQPKVLYSMAFSHDSSQIMTSLGHGVRIWNAATGEPDEDSAAYCIRVKAAIFSANDKGTVVGCDGGAIFLDMPDDFDPDVAFADMKSAAKRS